MMIFTFLAGLVASIGPLALAGGPIGLGIAWLGSMAANKTVKIIAISAGLLLLVGVSVGLTIRIQHLEQDSAAYKILLADQASLEQRYGCPGRPVHERDLAACLTARERDVADATAKEIQRQRGEAAQQQARLDLENAQLEAQQREANQAIDADAVHDDGAVPKVLLNTWARERAERGIK